LEEGEAISVSENVRGSVLGDEAFVVSRFRGFAFRVIRGEAFAPFAIQWFRGSRHSWRSFRAIRDPVVSRFASFAAELSRHSRSKRSRPGNSRQALVQSASNVRSCDAKGLYLPGERKVCCASGIVAKMPGGMDATLRLRPGSSRVDDRMRRIERVGYVFSFRMVVGMWL
jgi:hypothetical protein